MTANSPQAPLRHPWLALLPLGLFLLLAACGMSDDQAKTPTPLDPPLGTAVPLPQTTPGHGQPDIAAGLQQERLAALEVRLEQQEKSLQWLRESFIELQDSVAKTLAEAGHIDPDAQIPVDAEGRPKPERPEEPPAGRAPRTPIATAGPARRPPSSPPTRPEPRATKTEPPPFLVESVQTYGDESHIVVRAGVERVDLKVGDAYQGWTVLGTDGDAVLLKDGQGRTLRARSPWKR
jgi:hypothetical protein